MDILIEELDGSLWAAAVEKGRLRGLEIDPFEERVRFGSIFWARVKRIDAGMDAAFLDLDGESTGILYNRDIRLPQADGSLLRGGDVAIGKRLSPGQFIMVQAKTGYLPSELDEDLPPLEKTPVMTMAIALHGRYLIGTPLEKDNRISQRIRDPALRTQLQGMLDTLSSVHGCILRKASSGIQTDLLVREWKILNAIWDNVRKVAEGNDPCLLMLGPDAVQRTLADQAGARITRLDVVTMDQFQSVEEWCEIFAPDLVTKVRPVDLEGDKDLGLFEQRGFLDQIDSLLQPYALLSGGGNVIVQHTAAMVVMDVNSGPDRRGALSINLEAAGEIARQIKLRNLGGIIVIDFLKMPQAAQRKKIIDFLQTQFDDDPCTVQIHGFTKLGLLELTRARRTPTLAERVRALGLEEI